MSLADDIAALAHQASADTRETASKMVNAIIIIYEKHGLDAVPLDQMRELANAIATIPIVTRKRPAA